MTTPPALPDNLTPQSSCTLTDLVSRFNAQWCVYEHHLHNPETGEAELIYIDACSLTNVYQLREARANTEWQRIVTPNSWLYVKVIWTGPRADCLKEAHRHKNSLPAVPRCNKYGYSTVGQQRQVECSNGIQYENQLDASLKLGINQGQLSRHLSGQLKHVRGLTFRYKQVEQ